MEQARAKSWWPLLVLVAGCGPNQIVGHGGRDGGDNGDSMVIACLHPPADTDGDGISDADEGAPDTDTDGDGTPDYLDDDSDGDTIPDSIEGRNGNPCTPPVDSDGDGKPDFRDLDSDSATDSTVPDAEEAGPTPGMVVDTDSDGQPDYMDSDDDQDTIPDAVEMTPNGSMVAAITRATAPDTDGDGAPDYLDGDADGDGILDRIDGNVDTDGDGIPNYRDLDSDGDCIGDTLEGVVDTDSDGVYDFLDLDSDADGLVDGREDLNCNGKLDMCETDRLKQDTDGDGVSDLVEVEDCAVKTPQQQAMLMCQCDGDDPAVSPLTHGDFVFVVDYMKPPDPMLETLSLSTDVSQADVIFSLDSTGSMQQALTTLASTIANSVIPSAQMKVTDVAFGALDFKDYGDGYVVRYDHRIQTVKTNAGVMSIQGSLGALVAGGGGDGPEAGWEALYAIAGGPGINSSGYNSVLPLSTTAPQPPTAGEVQGTLHGAGFRTGSVPIIVTVSDAEWHDASGVPQSGENGLNDYAGTPSGWPSRQSAINQANSIGAHVMAIAGTKGGTYGDPKTRGLGTAQATGAVVTPADFGPMGTRPAGCGLAQCCTGISGVGETDTPAGSGKCPLSFTYDDTNGMGVNEAVVAGIVALANGLKFDIHVQAVDVDPNTVENFMDKLVPNLTGMGGAAMCITMTPSMLQDNFSGPLAAAGADGVPDTFPGIGGGVKICFDVVPKTNTTVLNTSDPQFFHAPLVKGVTGGSTVNLGTPRDVFFLVPPVVTSGPIP